MRLVSSVRSAYRKLFGRPPYGPQKLYEAKRRDPSYHGYTGVNVDRDFKKPGT